MDLNGLKPTDYRVFKNDHKKGFSTSLRNLHLNQIIYMNYCFANSKNRLTSTSFATPAPVGSYLML